MNRRSLITSAAAFIAAPAIIRVASIMPISVDIDYSIGLDEMRRAIHTHLLAFHSTIPAGVARDIERHYQHVERWFESYRTAG